MREDVQCGKITDVIQPNPVNHRTTLLYIGDERAGLENQREHKYSYPSVCTQCTIYRQQNLKSQLFRIPTPHIFIFSFWPFKLDTTWNMMFGS